MTRPVLFVRGPTAAATARRGHRGTLRVALLAICLPACGRTPPATLDELLAEHEITEPRYPATLRLVHEVLGDGPPTRVVTSIRREPFAFREECTVLDPHGVVVAQVSDGRFAWQTREGQAEMLQGEAARSFLVRAFVAGRQWCEPGPARARKYRGAGRLLPEVASATGFPGQIDLPAVDCSTGAALAIRLLFDPGDHRLLGWIEPYADGLAWTRYSELERHGTLRLPRTRTSGRQNPAKSVVATLVHADVNPPLDATLFAGPPLPSEDPITDGGALAVAAGSVPGSAWLLAKDLTINGRSFGPGLIDTGSSTSLVAPALVQALRLPTGSAFHAGAFTGRMEGFDCWVDRLQWGQRAAVQVSVGSAPLAGMPEVLPQIAPRFLLGGDELFAGGPIFDFAQGRLRHRHSPVLPLRTLPHAGEVVEVPAQRHPRDARLYVPLRYRGTELRALVDSGLAGMFFLSAMAADKCGVSRALTAVPGRRAFGTTATGLGGMERIDLMMPLQGFTLGPLCFGEVWTQVQAQPDGSDHPPSYEALVGAGALMLFPQVGIDSDRAMLEFALPPGSTRGADGRVSVPGPGIFAGCLLKATGMDRPAVVSDLLPDSPAAAAGLKPGDAVATIAGVVVASQDLSFHLRDLWLQPGQQVALDVFAPGTSEPRRVILRP